MRVMLGAMAIGGLVLLGGCMGSPAPARVTSTTAPAPSSALPTVIVTPTPTRTTTGPTVTVTAAAQHGRFIAMQFRCVAVPESAQASWSGVRAKMTTAPNQSVRYSNDALAGAGTLFLTKALGGQVGSKIEVRLKSAQGAATAVTVWATVVDPPVGYASGAVMSDAADELVTVMSTDDAAGSCSAGPSSLVLPPRYTWDPDDTR